MSAIGKKYGIPDDVVKAMVKDGVISCSSFNQHEMVHVYKTNLAQGMTEAEARRATSDTFNCTDTWVYIVVSKH